MKIIINYDLIDKAREAKTGFSLQKYTKVVGFTNGITVPTIILAAQLGNAELSYALELILKTFGYTLFYNAVHSLTFSFFRKNEACEQLAKLSLMLNRFCVETNLEMLKDARQYAVKYSVNFDTFPPKVEQKKYIMVPVSNDWGNNERSLVQEHIVGTRDYVLSYGEPEEKKVYSYTRRRIFNNGR